MPGSKAKVMSVNFCLDPSLSSDFFWINFILVRAPYMVAKIAIINSRPRGLARKCIFPNSPAKRSKDGTSWPGLIHTPIPDLIIVATGMK